MPYIMNPIMKEIKKKLQLAYRNTKTFTACLALCSLKGCYASLLIYKKGITFKGNSRKCELLRKQKGGEKHRDIRKEGRPRWQQQQLRAARLYTAKLCRACN